MTAPLAATVRDRGAAGLPAARVRLAAGTAALLAVAGATLLRVLANAPRTAAAVASPALDAATTAALVVPGLAAVALALVAATDVERVGLLSVGVFAVLTALSPAASVPAAGAVVGGGALAVGARGTWTDEWRSVRRAAVAGVLFVATALSLAGAMGVAAGHARPVGSELFALGVAGTLLFARPGRVGWLAAGLAAAGALYVGTTAPFVTGAVVLVAAAAVDLAAPFLVVGLAGATGAVVGSLRARNVAAAVGAATVLLAGVPATPTRATGVVLGLYVLVAATDADARTGGDPR